MRMPSAQIGAETGAFVMLAFAAAGLLLVADRRDIARAMAQDWLAQRGIESSFDVTGIDAGAFTGKMTVGPKDHPVFTADNVEVAYDLTAPWAGGPFHLSTRAVRIVRPRLRVTFDGKKFSAGPLDPLISDFLKRPKTNEPGPAVLIEDSLTTIATKEGDVRLTGDLALDDGKLLRFDGRLAPTELKGQDFAFASSGGSLKLRKVGETLSTDLRLSVDRLATGDIDLTGGQAAVAGVIPYPDPKSQAVAGGTDLRAAVVMDHARLADATASKLGLNARLVGGLAGGASNPVFAGAIGGAASVGALEGKGFKAQALKANFTAPRATLKRNAAAVPFVGRLAAGRLEASDFALVNATAALDGRFNADAKGYLLAANADARGQSSLPAARAQRIAHAVPVLSGDPGQERAMAAALRSFTARAANVNLTAHNGEVRVALAGPVTVDSPSGGHAILTPHGPLTLIGGKPSGFDFAMSGGGLPELQAKVASFSYADGALDSRLELKAAVNAPPAEKATIDAEGRLRMAGGRTTFELARCADVSAALVDFGDTDIKDAAARLCPSGGPLVVASGGTWRIRGRFENGKGEIPVWEVAGADASGQFDTSGRGDMDSADIRVEAIRVSDTTKTKRFNPLRASGRAQLAGGVWRGAFPVATETNRPIANVALEHVVATGVGHADIDARGLVFADKGLQPAEIAPLGEVIRAASGPAAFTGRLDWAPGGQSISSGDLTVTNLAFRSPAGQVSGVNTTLHFTSLIPLVSAPNQTITAGHVDAITPLDNIAASFDLTADALHLGAASATLAKGLVSLEPLTVPLADGRTIEGVLNIKQIDVGEIVAATNFADRIKVDAILDGRVPFKLSPEGLRFTQGHLVADRPGRISISRTVLSNVKSDAAAPANPMDATQPAPQFNAVQDFAYQAMENLAFETMEATVNSVDNGRLNVLFSIHGQNDPPVAKEARISVFDALRGKALSKPVDLPKGTPVNLTLDTSLNFDELLAAWERGWVDAAKP